MGNNRNNGIIIDIGFTSDIQKYLKDLEQNLQKVDFDKVIGLSDVFDKQYQKMTDIIRKMQTELAHLNGTDLEQVATQLNKITGYTTNLATAFTTLYNSLPDDIQKKLGLSDILRSLSDITGSVQGVNGAFDAIAKNTAKDIRVINDNAARLLENFKAIRAAQDALNNPRANGGLGNIKNDKKALIELAKYWNLADQAIEDYYEAINNHKNGDQYLVAYANSLETARGAANAFIKSTQDIKNADLKLPQLKLVGENASVNELLHEIEVGFSEAKDLLQQRAEDLIAMGKEIGVDLPSLLMQSTRKGEEPISVNIAIAKGATKSLAKNVEKVIATVNQIVSKTPVMVEVQLVSAYQSKKNQESIKQIQAQIKEMEAEAANAGSEAEAAKLTSMTQNLSTLIDRMNRQINNALLFTVDIDTKRAVESVQNFCKETKKELEELKKSIVINPTFEISPEQINQIKSDMINALSEDDTDAIKTKVIDALLAKIKDISTAMKEMTNSFKQVINDSFSENVLTKADSLNQMYVQLLQVNSELSVFIKGISKLDNEKISRNMLAMAAEESKMLAEYTETIKAQIEHEDAVGASLAIKNKQEILDELSEIKVEMESIFTTDQIDAWENRLLEVLSNVKTKFGFIFNPISDKNTTNLLADFADDITLSDQLLRKHGTYKGDYQGQIDYLVEKLEDLGGRYDSKEDENLARYEWATKAITELFDRKGKNSDLKLRPREHGGIVTNDGKVIALSAAAHEGSASLIKNIIKDPKYKNNIRSTVHSHSGDIIWMPSIKGGDIDSAYNRNRRNNIPYSTTIAEKEIAVIDSNALTKIFDAKNIKTESLEQEVKDYIKNNKEVFKSDEFKNFARPYTDYRKKLEAEGVKVDARRENSLIAQRYAFEQVLKQHGINLNDFAKIYSHEEFRKANPLGLSNISDDATAQTIAKAFEGVLQVKDENSYLESISKTLQEILSLLQTREESSENELQRLKARKQEIIARKKEIRNNSDAGDNEFSEDLFDAKHWAKIVRKKSKEADQISVDKLLGLQNLFKNNPSESIINEAFSTVQNSKLPETTKQSLINYLNRIKEQVDKGAEEGVKASKDQPKTKTVTMSKAQYEAYVKSHPGIVPMGTEGAWKGNFEKHLEGLQKQGRAQQIEKNGKKGKWQIQVEVEDNGEEAKSKVKVKPKKESKATKPVEKTETKEETKPQSKTQPKKESLSASAKAEIEALDAEEKKIDQRIAELEKAISKSDTKYKGNAFADIEKLDEKKIDKLVALFTRLSTVLSKLSGDSPVVVTNLNSFIESIGKLPGRKNPVLTQLENLVQNSGALAPVKKAVDDNKKTPKEKGSKKKSNANIEQSADAVNKETDAMNQLEGSAKKAAKAKEGFEKANKKVEKSVETSLPAIKSESDELSKFGTDEDTFKNFFNGSKELYYWIERMAEIIKKVNAQPFNMEPKLDKEQLFKDFQSVSEELAQRFNLINGTSLTGANMLAAFKQLYSNVNSEYKSSSKLETEYQNAENLLRIDDEIRAQDQKIAEQLKYINELREAGKEQAEEYYKLAQYYAEMFAISDAKDEWEEQQKITTELQKIAQARKEGELQEEEIIKLHEKEEQQLTRLFELQEVRQRNKYTRDVEAAYLENYQRDITSLNKNIAEYSNKIAGLKKIVDDLFKGDATATQRYENALIEINQLYSQIIQKGELLSRNHGWDINPAVAKTGTAYTNSFEKLLSDIRDLKSYINLPQEIRDAFDNMVSNTVITDINSIKTGFANIEEQIRNIKQAEADEGQEAKERASLEKFYAQKFDEIELKKRQLETKKRQDKENLEYYEEEIDYLIRLNKALEEGKAQEEAYLKVKKSTKDFKTLANSLPKIVDKAFKGDHNAANDFVDTLSRIKSLWNEISTGNKNKFISDEEIKNLETAYTNILQNVIGRISKIDIVGKNKEYADLQKATESDFKETAKSLDLTSMANADTDAFQQLAQVISQIITNVFNLGEIIPKTTSASASSVIKLSRRMGDFLIKNSSIPKEYKKQVEEFQASLRTMREKYGDNLIPKEEFNNLKLQFEDLEAKMKEMGYSGKSMFDKIGRAIKNSLIQTVKMYLSWMRLVQYVRQGVQEVINLDTALTKMSYTMNITNSQLENMGQQIVKMAQDLSTSVENISQIYQIYANLQTTQEELEKTAKPTAILANLSGVDASTAADQLQGVLNQFELTANDAMHIVDVYDKISASIKVDYSKGIAGMADAVKNVGNFANEAGMSFEQLSAIVGRVMQQTRMEGGQIGVSLKTIMTRISKANKLADDGEVDNKTLSQASQALKRWADIDVYTPSGEFREFDIIMTELAEKWDQLSDAEQANISFAIAATRQKFVSVYGNMHNRIYLIAGNA